MMFQMVNEGPFCGVFEKTFCGIFGNISIFFKGKIEVVILIENFYFLVQLYLSLFLSFF